MLQIKVTNKYHIENVLNAHKVTFCKISNTFPITIFKNIFFEVVFSQSASRSKTDCKNNTCEDNK